MKPHAVITSLNSLGILAASRQAIGHPHRRVRTTEGLSREALQPRAVYPPATDIPSTWRYVGCYKDAPGRTLGAYIVDGVTFDQGRFLFLQGANATNEYCIDAWASQGYPFAGTMYYSQCECSYEINVNATINEDGCSTPCDGAPTTETCSGPNYISVYTNGGTYKFPEPAADLLEPWTYKGCYTDCYDDGTTFKGRPEDSYSMLGSYLNASTCISYCNTGNYTLAGLEGNECFCADELNTLSVETENCIQPCLANRAEACGADQKITVYDRPEVSTSLLLYAQTLCALLF
jgi:hypothetical protein